MKSRKRIFNYPHITGLLWISGLCGPLGCVLQASLARSLQHFTCTAPFSVPVSPQSHAGCTEHVLLCKDPDITTGTGGEGSLQGECSVDVLAHGVAFAHGVPSLPKGKGRHPPPGCPPWPVSVGPSEACRSAPATIHTFVAALELHQC